MNQERSTPITAEKRRTQRIRLYSPIRASIDGNNVVVVDISAIGARIEHDAPLSVGKSVTLQLSLDEDVVEITCEVTRCKLQKSVSRDAIRYTAGLNFSARQDEALAVVTRMISNVVRGDFEAREMFR